MGGGLESPPIFGDIEGGQVSFFGPLFCVVHLLLSFWLALVDDLICDGPFMRIADIVTVAK